MTAETVTVETLLRQGAARLRQAGVDTARLDARVLLGAVLEREPSSLLPGDMSAVDADRQAKFSALIGRRSAHEPVARILGVREFFGRSFRLSPATLEPRPDSEATVELALESVGAEGRVLDLGTGTGCLLLTVLAERPGLTGLGVDISAEAVATARRNAESLDLAGRAEFRTSDWFDGVDGPYDLILSNPPYIPAAEIGLLMPEVRDHDPRLALAGGVDGLAAYRAIFAGAAAFLLPGGRLVLEIGAGQQADVVRLGGAHGLIAIATATDLGGHVRAIAFHTGA